MTPAHLLVLLRSSGFRVKVRDGKLEVNPASKLFPEDMADLRKHRDDILALLAEEEADDQYRVSKEIWP